MIGRMANQRSIRNSARRFVGTLILLAATPLASCSSQSHAPLSPEVSKQQNIAGLPYHPLVYHLDLSILAYQLYAQTLVWPFDPYYEDLDSGLSARAGFMAKVRNWATVQGQKQVGTGASTAGYRGPGRLGGFDDNPLHDPILYRYDGLDPWSSAITNGGKEWVEYLTPEVITDRIRDVYMCSRQAGRPENAVSVARIASRPSSSSSGGRDVLLAFEGGTGDKGEAGQPASQSVMGFILLRRRPGSSAYDIHISFRGSRSGSLLRTVAQANWTSAARGNPDWITDLGYDLIGPETGAGHVTTVGKVHRGFARSIKTILPNAFACLNKAAALAPRGAPENIFVTGHSLGGGLAQQFASAVLLGNQFGPDGAGPAMPRSLRQWQWQQMKLITYSAPRAGDPIWAERLTEKALQSEFHAKDALRFDQNALAPNDPGILPRLDDPDRPAGYRVLVSTDPVSTSVVPGRKPVGKTVYVDKLRSFAIVTPHNPDSHEPVTVRDLMRDSINDPGIPATVWQYRTFDQETADGAAVTNQMRLQAVFLNYHLEMKSGLDRRRFERDATLFNALLAE